jgi:hypothetical protein
MKQKNLITISYWLFKCVLSQNKSFRNKTSIIALTSLLSGFCFGQNDGTFCKQNGFQLDLGLNQLKEENLHPKVHSGFCFGLRYNHLRTKVGQRLIQFEARFSRPKTKYESLSASMNIQLYGSYSFLFHKVEKNKITFHLGPDIGFQYNLSHYPNWDESHLYWSDYLGLGVYNKLKYQLNKKQELVLDISAPIASIISRPELNRLYKIDDVTFGGIVKSMHSNLEGAFWNHSFAIKSRLEYHFAISKRVTHAICYSFNYSRMRANEGLLFQNSQHLIGLKLYY